MRSKIYHLCPKVSKSDSKRYPKESQKSSKWTWLDLSKHMVITAWEPHWPTSGEVWWRCFFQLLSGRPLFACVLHFDGKLSKNDTKMDSTSPAKWPPLLINSPKVVQLGPKGGQGIQKDTKMKPRVTTIDPKGTKMTPQDTQNNGSGINKTKTKNNNKCVRCP